MSVYGLYRYYKKANNLFWVKGFLLPVFAHLKKFLWTRPGCSQFSIFVSCISLCIYLFVIFRNCWKYIVQNDSWMIVSQANFTHNGYPGENIHWAFRGRVCIIWMKFNQFYSMFQEHPGVHFINAEWWCLKESFILPKPVVKMLSKVGILKANNCNAAI